jgi:hypothetical protein
MVKSGVRQEDKGDARCDELNSIVEGELCQRLCVQVTIGKGVGGEIEWTRGRRRSWGEDEIFWSSAIQEQVGRVDADQVAECRRIRLRRG